MWHKKKTHVNSQGVSGTWVTKPLRSVDGGEEFFQGGVDAGDAFVDDGDLLFGFGNACGVGDDLEGVAHVVVEFANDAHVVYDLVSALVDGVDLNDGDDADDNTDGDGIEDASEAGVRNVSDNEEVQQVLEGAGDCCYSENEKNASTACVGYFYEKGTQSV
jgi:hypothetical protein